MSRLKSCCCAEFITQRKRQMHYFTIYTFMHVLYMEIVHLFAQYTVNATCESKWEKNEKLKFNLSIMTENYFQKTSIHFKPHMELVWIFFFLAVQTINQQNGFKKKKKILKN